MVSSSGQLLFTAVVRVRPSLVVSETPSRALRSIWPWSFTNLGGTDDYHLLFLQTTGVLEIARRSFRHHVHNALESKVLRLLYPSNFLIATTYRELVDRNRSAFPCSIFSFEKVRVLLQTFEARGT